MKDKDKIFKTITLEKKKELKRSMMKWLNNTSKNIDNKLNFLKKNLKMSNHKQHLLNKI